MIEILIILALIAVNGLLAMSEIAVVSARKTRLRHLAAEGSRGAQVALDLAEEPNRFLSTVQVGITLVGVLAGAFGGAALADDLAPWIGRVPVLTLYASEIAFITVVVVITYLSLVAGELAPKRVGLRSPERIAVLVARPMRGMSVAAAPLVTLLSGPTNLLLRLVGRPASAEEPVTEEEISFLLAEGAQAGVFEVAERDIIERVFRFGDQSVAAMMTPRNEVDCLNIGENEERLRKSLAAHPHTRFVVCDGNLDDPVGIVHVKDLLAQLVREEPLDIASLVRRPPFVPESTPALRVLEQFKETGEHLAIVMDEYGGVAGLVTLDDVLEAIVGDIPWKDEPVEPDAIQRADGSWLVDGMMPVEEFKVLFKLRELPGEEPRAFRTLGGFVVAFLGHIPTASEAFTCSGLRIEVVDMDGRRVDKVLVVPEAHRRTASDDRS